jgi:signal transduction histidine kinase
LPPRTNGFYLPARAIHDESTYEVSGAGLGLYTSKAIIEAHHGQIWMESELNRGSTFSFSLPTIEPGQDEPEDGTEISSLKPISNLDRL